jgi:hypothetical protein
VGIEPTSLVWKTSAFAARPRAQKSGRRESRTLKAHRSAVFGTAAVACRLVLPFRAAVAGIEPALVSLTGSRLTIGLHRKESRGWASNPRSPVSETGGLASFPTSRKSTQRELNPHVLHGEQAGCRYITGASVLITLRVMLHHAERDDYIFSGTRGTRTLTTLVKSQVCCR